MLGATVDQSTYRYAESPAVRAPSFLYVNGYLPIHRNGAGDRLISDMQP